MTSMTGRITMGQCTGRVPLMLWPGFDRFRLVPRLSMTCGPGKARSADESWQLTKGAAALCPDPSVPAGTPIHFCHPSLGPCTPCFIAHAKNSRQKQAKNVLQKPGNKCPSKLRSRSCSICCCRSRTGYTGRRCPHPLTVALFNRRPVSG
jgi:hypothetical protein